MNTECFFVTNTTYIFKFYHDYIFVSLYKLSTQIFRVINDNTLKLARIRVGFEPTQLRPKTFFTNVVSTTLIGERGFS